MKFHPILIAALMFSTSIMGCDDGGEKPEGGEHVLNVAGYQEFDGQVGGDARNFTILESSGNGYLGHIHGKVAFDTPACRDLIAMPYLSANRVQQVLKILPLSNAKTTQELVDEGTTVKPAVGSAG